MQELLPQESTRKKLIAPNRGTLEFQQSSKRSKVEENQQDSPDPIGGLTPPALPQRLISTAPINTSFFRVARPTNDGMPVEECGSDTDLPYQFSRCRV